MKCPVCCSSDLESLFSLRAPLYQHPLDCYIDQRTKTLDYAICNYCGHSFMHGYDLDELLEIYEDKYYTPCVDATSKDLFFLEAYSNFLDQFSIDPRKTSFLEVGCSMGIVLELIASQIPAARFIGVDPDKRNIQHAASRAVESLSEYFLGFYPIVPPREVLNALEDVHVYSRHVIEHVEDPVLLIDSMRNLPGLASVTLETPCSDYYLKSKNPLDPFHVEHLHVFSRKSASLLFGSDDSAFSTVNQFGDIILSISDRAALSCNAGNDNVLSSATGIHHSDDPAGLMMGLQAALSAKRQRVDEYSSSSKDYIFWGCGSKCSGLLAMEMNPSAIFDGNINKCGKFMPGYRNAIRYATRESLVDYQACDLVISTSFADSVMQSIELMGLKFSSVSVL